MFHANGAQYTLCLYISSLSKKKKITLNNQSVYFSTSKNPLNFEDKTQGFTWVIMQRGEEYELLINGKNFEYIKNKQASESYHQDKVSKGETIIYFKIQNVLVYGGQNQIKFTPKKENILEGAEDFDLKDEEYEYNLKYFKEKEEQEKQKKQAQLRKNSDMTNSNARTYGSINQIQDSKQTGKIDLQKEFASFGAMGFSQKSSNSATPWPNSFDFNSLSQNKQVNTQAQQLQIHKAPEQQKMPHIIKATVQLPQYDPQQQQQQQPHQQQQQPQQMRKSQQINLLSDDSEEEQQPEQQNRLKSSQGPIIDLPVQQITNRQSIQNQQQQFQQPPQKMNPTTTQAPIIDLLEDLNFNASPQRQQQQQQPYNINYSSPQQNYKVQQSYQQPYQTNQEQYQAQQIIQQQPQNYTQQMNYQQQQPQQQLYEPGIDAQPQQQNNAGDFFDELYNGEINQQIQQRYSLQPQEFVSTSQMPISRPSNYQQYKNPNQAVQNPIGFQQQQHQQQIVTPFDDEAFFS